MSARASLVPLAGLLAACSVGALDTAGLECPCVTGYRCDVATNTCVVPEADAASSGGPDGLVPGVDAAKHDSGAGHAEAGGGRETTAPIDAPSHGDTAMPSTCNNGEPGLQCGASCIQPQTDPQNCGACGHDCVVGSCAKGVCQPVVLASGFGVPGRIAVDTENVYWLSNGPTPTPGSPGTIYSVFKQPLAGGATTTLVSNASGQTSGIAVSAGGTFVLGTTTGGETWVAVFPAGSGPPMTLSPANEGPSENLTSDANRVYWGEVNTDMNAGRILSWTGSGSADVVAMGSFLPEWMTTSGSNVYWVDLAAEQVESVPTTGGTPTTLSIGAPPVFTIAGTEVYAALTTLAGWTTPTVDIYKLPLAGGTPTTLASVTPASCSEVAVDSSHLYCTDGWNGLRRVGLSGAEDVVLGGTTPYGLALTTSFVYWTDGSGGGSVLKLAK